MGEMNWLLVAVCAVFFIIMMRGYSRGFLKMAASLFITVLGFFVMTTILPNLTDIVSGSPYIYEAAYERVKTAFRSDNGDYNDASKTEQNEVIEDYRLPELIISDLIVNNTREGYEELKVTLFEDYVAKYLTLLLIRAGVFLVGIVAFAICSRVILVVTGLIGKIPVIHGVNKWLGLFSGFLMALILVWLFFLILSLLVGNKTADLLIADIKASSLLSTLYDENPFISLLLM